MANLKIISVSEEKATPSGKRLKELEINKDGMEWNFKRVTIWEDHPAFEHVKEGLLLTKSYVEEKDQKAINPNTGKPYKNYTLKEGEPQQNVANPDKIEQKLNAIYDVLRQVYENTKKEDVNYPDEDISPEDIPF